MHAQDKQLVGKFLSGDGQAFEKLLNKYLKPVYNFLYQFTQDSSTTDDLAQITFIKAWKNISRYNPQKSFKTWIFTIAKRTAFDHLKKRKAIPFSMFMDSEGYNALEEIDENKLLPDEILEREDLAKDLEKKLDEIAPALRTILILRYKEDFSLSEISEILDEPYNTTKSRHNRALRKLKETLSIKL